MLGGVSWGRRVLTMRVRPDDAASWGHAWRRGNTGPSYKSKMWKNCKSRAASHMDESSLECFHWSCAKLVPMRPARPVWSKIQENFELDFHPLGDFSLRF